MKKLILKQCKESEISRLRMCYKHFNKNNYNGNPKLKRLIRATILFMIETETCTIQIKNIEELSRKQTQVNDQPQKVIEILSIESQLCESQPRRSNLSEITRKKKLSPIALKLYDNTIKLRS